MSFPTDIEIAQQATMKPIAEIAQKLGVNDDTQSVKIVYLIELLTLIVHLFIDRIHALDTALQLEVNVVFGQLVGNLSACLFKEVAVDAVLAFNVIVDFIVADRVQIRQRQILKLMLDALHTEGVQKVVLTSPAADIATTKEQAPVCTEINIEFVIADDTNQ